MPAKKPRPDIILVPQSRKSQASRIVLILVAVSVLMFAAFLLGGVFSSSSSKLAGTETAMQKLEAENKQLRLDVEILKQDAQVSDQAMQLLEQRIGAFQEKRQELEKELAFHKSLTDPSTQQGIQVSSVYLGSTQEPDTFEFNLVLAQAGLWHPMIKGGMTITVVGWQDGALVEYPVSSLSEDFKTKRLPVGFRYFQSSPGPGEAVATLVIPDGFVPERIEVFVDSRTRGVKSFRTTFNWADILQDFTEE